MLSLELQIWEAGGGGLLAHTEAIAGRQGAGAAQARPGSEPHEVLITELRHAPSRSRSQWCPGRLGEAAWGMKGRATRRREAQGACVTSGPLRASWGASKAGLGTAHVHTQERPASRAGRLRRAPGGAVGGEGYRHLCRLGLQRKRMGPLTVENVCHKTVLAGHLGPRQGAGGDALRVGRAGSAEG